MATDPDYGKSVAIEGNKIIVGSPGAGTMGAVYIFEQNYLASGNKFIKEHHEYRLGAEPAARMSTFTGTSQLSATNYPYSPMVYPEASNSLGAGVALDGDFLAMGDSLPKPALPHRLDNGEEPSRDRGMSTRL